MKIIKKIGMAFLVFLLLISSLPISAGASGVTLRTDLVEGLTTKSDKITFDLWAQDGAGNKINASAIEVSNNDKKVDINWDDVEKTSYTIYLDVGVNNLEISYGTDRLTYTLYREAANDGDVIGHFVFSLDAFSLGMGYLVEPIEVPIVKGRNAAEELDDILTANGYTYKSTGTLKSGFYLATIFKDNLFDKPISIPTPLKSALNGIYDETDYSPASGLGEFDINYMSGWMYSVNNVFPNVGFSDKYMLDGDVMRVQFTLAYGQDIGGGEAMGGGVGGDFFDKVNKDALTKKIAQINTKGKETYLINQTRIHAYNNALAALATINPTQQTLDHALVLLQNADADTATNGTDYVEEDNILLPSQPDVENKKEKASANRVTSQIQVLPEIVGQSDIAAVRAARQSYDALSELAKKYVTNYVKLVAAEKQIATDGGNDTEADVQKAIQLISNLPAIVTLMNEEDVKAARQSYNLLTTSQKNKVTNYSVLLSAEAALSALQNEAISKVKVSQTQALIDALPKTITEQSKKVIEEARTSYDALLPGEKELIKNYEKLLDAEIAYLALESTGTSAVSDVEVLISTLPTEITEEHRSLVEKVQTAYEALSSKEKLQVKNREKLLSAIEILQGKEGSYVVKGSTAYFLTENSLFKNTVSANQLKSIYENKAVDKISFTHANGMEFMLDKKILQKANPNHSLTIDVQTITIGSQKEFIANVSAAQPLMVPMTLKVPSALWGNGYLLRKDGNNLAAVPHTTKDELNAQILSSTAYVYTTNKVTFLDIENHSSKEEIVYLANRHVVKGTNGLYNPNQPITRAQFAVMIARALGLEAVNPTRFNDIKGQWYEKEVQALYEAGIVNGTSATTFNPNSLLSRQHGAIMMARVLRYANVTQPQQLDVDYKDSSMINPDYIEDISWLQHLNIMSGSNGIFAPQNNLTRGQMAKILKRTLNTSDIM